MLAVAQGLVRRPRLLMLDEPSAGLSPVLVDRVLSVAATLRDQGTSVLLVEQLVEKALRLADRVYAMAQGRVVMEAATSEPDLPHRLERAYFGQDRGDSAAHLTGFENRLLTQRNRPAISPAPPGQGRPGKGYRCRKVCLAGHWAALPLLPWERSRSCATRAARRR